MRRATFATVICLTVALARIGAQNPPAPPAQRGPAAPCPVSADPEFGFSAQKPVRIGGGAMFVAAREQRYLNGLRDSAGRPIRFRRLGSTQAPGGRPEPLDMYEITVDGVVDPRTMYIDVYRFDEPEAPQGFSCAGFGLSPPPVDAFLSSDQIVRLAIDQGAKRSFLPIPLDTGGTVVHGVAFNRFHMMARAAKALADAGTPADPANPPRELATAPMVVLAYPKECGSRKVSAASIDITPQQGPAVRRIALHTGDAAKKLLPEFPMPEGTIAATYMLSTLRSLDTVRVAYDDEACGASREVALPVQFTRAQPASLPQPPIPGGMTRPRYPIVVQAIIDIDGTFQQPEVLGGPDALKAPALSAVAAWRAQPARINGTAVVSETLAIVQFR
jgi:hypothetical protein